MTRIFIQKSSIFNIWPLQITKTRISNVYTAFSGQPIAFCFYLFMKTSSNSITTRSKIWYSWFFANSYLWLKSQVILINIHIERKLFSFVIRKKHSVSKFKSQKLCWVLLSISTGFMPILPTHTSASFIQCQQKYFCLSLVCNGWFWGSQFHSRTIWNLARIYKILHVVYHIKNKPIILQYFHNKISRNCIVLRRIKQNLTKLQIIMQKNIFDEQMQLKIRLIRYNFM